MKFVDWNDESSSRQKFPNECSAMTGRTELSKLRESVGSDIVLLRICSERASEGGAKTERGRSSEILPRSGFTGARTSQEERLQPRGYDLVRVLRSPLAAGRGWQTHHGDDPAAHLRSLRDFNVKRGQGAGRWREETNTHGIEEMRSSGSCLALDHRPDWLVAVTPTSTLSFCPAPLAT
jgi:hypothetical protein